MSVTELAQDLAGRRIVITAQRRAAELAQAFERRGAEVLHAPTTSAIPSVNDAELRSRTAELIQDPPDVMVVTTGIGFRGWLESASAAGTLDQLVASLSKARIVARGAKARGAIIGAGLTPDWVAESETDAEVMAHVLAQGVAEQRVAVQRHGSGDDGLDDAFLGGGASVVPLVVYRSGPSPDPAAVIRSVQETAERRCDAVVFTSAPGVAAWLDVARKEGVLEDVVAACQHDVMAAAVGPVTAKPLQDVGIQPVQPDRYRLGALIRTVTTALARTPA